MAGRVVVGVVDPHDHGEVGVLGRRADDHLPRALVEMLCRLRPFGEAPGALGHHVDPQLAPGQQGQIGRGQDLDGPTLELDGVTVGGHFAGPHAVDAVVLEKMGQSLGVGEVVDRHYLDVQALRRRRPAQRGGLCGRIR